MLLDRGNSNGAISSWRSVLYTLPCFLVTSFAQVTIKDSERCWNLQSAALYLRKSGAGRRMVVVLTWDTFGHIEKVSASGVFLFYNECNRAELKVLAVPIAPHCYFEVVCPFLVV
eukprot:gb/GEZJ01006744.1/.p1 GENE.gb/GEZJ01006744.1/~~gb/GEZJ01006744.1/.p1  ORF type:complete len:115 (+),score=8.12 gb/GEZJ01006744.1/:510-854(+)